MLDLYQWDYVYPKTKIIFLKNVSIKDFAFKPFHGGNKKEEEEEMILTIFMINTRKYMIDYYNKMHNSKITAKQNTKIKGIVR